MYRSTFTGLNTSSQGVNIAQRQLDVTAHNISNANVTGYSRQRYITQAVPPKGWNSQFAYPERGKPGGGVETLSLDQIRDLFLDRQFRNEQTSTTYWETRSNAMYYIEDVFNSIDSNSLDGVLASFFASLQELSKNSTDEAVRTNVVSEAKKIVDVFHVYDEQLTNLMEQQNFQMHEKVIHANQLLTQIAALNDSIFRFELGGSTANDLRDQRANMLDELSSLMDISYEEKSAEPPMYNIYGLELTQLRIVAGSDLTNEDAVLVDHLDSYMLKLEAIEHGSGENEIYDLLEPLPDSEYESPFDKPFYKIFLSGSEDPPNPEANVYDGEHNGIELISYDESTGEGLLGYTGGLLQSYLDVRDGVGTVDDVPGVIGIPYYIKELNRFVESFTTAFNEIHSQGYTYPTGIGGSSDTGVDFFDPELTTARTIQLSQAILESSFNIAASRNEAVTLDPEGHAQTGNNEIILELIQRIKEGVIEGLGNSPEGFYKNYLGIVASEASAANDMYTQKEVMLSDVQKQRTSVSSVSEDEEMTNMVRFNHAYNASARCITTIDEMLDKLINGTGRVGLV
ncbi:MAG: flagellar hook-associated protein FlgK [Oscillospiraceae bacterium]|jgi:flagellar hook-associated protein 1 FlgK|nr:flagellar hook-associated protein FlgK [Oscillospiraceae bacterium]